MPHKEDHLHPVLWLNRQWAVTTYGLEAVGTVVYYIDAERLWEPDWHRHMEEKEWVDIDAFDDALEVGQVLFAHLKPVMPRVGK